MDGDCCDRSFYIQQADSKHFRTNTGSYMAIQLRQICLVVENLKPVVADLHAIFGLKVCFVDEGVGVFGLENSLFSVGTNFLEVVAPVKSGTPAGRFLKRRRGDSGYMVICQCDTRATQLSVRERATSEDVRVAWEQDINGFQCMQLHPGDTGGAFFELDWDPAGDFTGHWEPAGGNAWTDVPRAPLIADFQTVEIESHEPETMAKLWSKIADVSLQKDDLGRPIVQLQNAEIRFVSTTDEHGEGLTGIDVRVTELPRIRTIAADRDCLTSDTTVKIGGVNFHLRSE